MKEGKKENLQFIMTLPDCPKCDAEMKMKGRIITCEFHDFIGVTDLVCACGHKEENIFNIKCE